MAETVLRWAADNQPVITHQIGRCSQVVPAYSLRWACRLIQIWDSPQNLEDLSEILTAHYIVSTRSRSLAENANGRISARRDHVARTERGCGMAHTKRGHVCVLSPFLFSFFPGFFSSFFYSYATNFVYVYIFFYH